MGSGWQFPIHSIQYIPSYMKIHSFVYHQQDKKG